MRASSRKYHYIYKITRFDGKYYIGMHSTDDLEDGYFGSGQRLWHSINYHGKESHSKEILEFLSDRESLRLREKAIVNVKLLKDPHCMNLIAGGGGGVDKIILKQSTREKMSISAKNRPPISEATRKKQSESRKGTHRSPETREKMSISGKIAQINRPPCSEETKKKMSISQKNRAPISEETHKKLSESATRVQTGRKQTPERIEKRAACLRGKKQRPEVIAKRSIELKKIVKCPHCGKEGGICAMGKYHFKNCKFRIPTSLQPL
jgi:hypothetical protein